MSDVVARYRGEFALHATKPTSWTVSAIGSSKTISIPMQSATLRHLAGRVAEGPKRTKLAVVEIDMPLWLAKKEKLA